MQTQINTRTRKNAIFRHLVDFGLVDFDTDGVISTRLLLDMQAQARFKRYESQILFL
ncbi:MAG: hypothetical protein U0894_08590 [Pirellulales bacterium]